MVANEAKGFIICFCFFFLSIFYREERGRGERREKGESREKREGVCGPYYKGYFC